MTASLTPDEFRAAAEIHAEIAPEYRDAVVESFVERVGRQVDARVDRRLADAVQPGKDQARPNPLALAITSMALGIPLSGICLGLNAGDQLIGLLIVWLAIAVINTGYALSIRPRRQPRRLRD